MKKLLHSLRLLLVAGILALFCAPALLAQDGEHDDQIEQATGINFMPVMGEPNVLEQAIDQRWLNT